MGTIQYDYQNKLFGTTGRINKKDYADVFCWKGVALTVNGIVIVESIPKNEHHGPLTHLTMVHNSTFYNRTIKRFYSKIGLARIAAKYAKEITS